MPLTVYHHGTLEPYEMLLSKYQRQCDPRYILWVDLEQNGGQVPDGFPYYIVDAERPELGNLIPLNVFICDDKGNWNIGWDSYLAIWSSMPQCYYRLKAKITKLPVMYAFCKQQHEAYYLARSLKRSKIEHIKDSTASDT